MKIDNINDAMADIAESIDLVDEMGKALSQSIGPELDEDDMADELAALENEVADEELLDLNVLPHAPKDKINIEQPQQQQHNK